MNRLLHSRGPLRLSYYDGEGNHLGDIERNYEYPTEHQHYICKNCFTAIGTVLASTPGYRSGRTIRPTLCATCGGENTIFFQPYLYHGAHLYEQDNIPLTLLTYELTAAIEGNPSWTLKPSKHSQTRKLQPVG